MFSSVKKEKEPMQLHHLLRQQAHHVKKIVTILSLNLKHIPVPGAGNDGSATTSLAPFRVKGIEG